MKKILATTTALIFALGLASAALAGTDKPAAPAADKPQVMEKAPVTKGEPQVPAAATQETKQEKQELQKMEQKMEKTEKGKPEKGHEYGATKKSEAGAKAVGHETKKQEGQGSKK